MRTTFSTETLASFPKSRASQGADSFFEWHILFLSGFTWSIPSMQLLALYAGFKVLERRTVAGVIFSEPVKEEIRLDICQKIYTTGF